MKKRNIYIILTAIIALLVVSVMIFFTFINPIIKEKKEEESLVPLKISEQELIDSYPSYSEYYAAIGEDPNDIHGEQGFDSEGYSYRVFLENKGYLFDQDVAERCCNELTPWLSTYMDARDPDGENYIGHICEGTLRDLSTSYIFYIKIPDLDDLKIKVCYDKTTHNFGFWSDLDPEEEPASDEEEVEFYDYVVDEITNIVTEDMHETQEEIVEEITKQLESGSDE